MVVKGGALDIGRCAGSVTKAASVWAKDGIKAGGTGSQILKLTKDMEKDKIFDAGKKMANKFWSDFKNAGSIDGNAVGWGNFAQKKTCELSDFFESKELPFKRQINWVLKRANAVSSAMKNALQAFDDISGLAKILNSTIDACMKVAMDARKAAIAGAKMGSFLGPVGTLVGGAVGAIASVALNCVSGNTQKCLGGLKQLFTAGKAFYTNTKAAILKWKENWNKKLQTCDPLHKDLAWIHKNKPFTEQKKAYESAVKTAREAAELVTSEDKQKEFIERLGVACKSIERKDEEHPYCDKSCICTYNFVAEGEKAMKKSEETKAAFDTTASDLKKTAISNEKMCALIGDQCPTWTDCCYDTERKVCHKKYDTTVDDPGGFCNKKDNRSRRWHQRQIREADREAEALLRDFELVDAELGTTVLVHTTRLKGAAASDGDIAAIAGLNLRETPKSRVYALDISPSASARWSRASTQLSVAMEEFVTVATESFTLQSTSSLASSGIDWSVCKGEKAQRLDARTTQWAISEQRETLVLLAMRRLSVMERMLRYKTLADTTALKMQRDLGDHPGSAEILKIKTAFHELVFKNMEDLGGTPTTSWQYYEILKSEDPDFFTQLTYAALTPTGFAAVDVPLAVGSRYRHVMVLDQQVQAYLLPSPQNVGNMLVTIKKGPSSIIVPRGSNAKPETWLHPDISKKRGYSFNYDSETCKPLTQPCTRACKESFAPVSPFGPWMLRIVPEDTGVNVTSMFANVDRLRLAFQIRYYIDDTGSNADNRIFDMDESVCGRATCSADGELGPSVNNDCTRFSACGLNPCANGGKCSATLSNDAECTCVFGFSGDRCETAIDPCLQLNGGCLSGSTCTYMGPGTSTCSCPLAMIFDPAVSGMCRAPESGECLLRQDDGAVDCSGEGPTVDCLLSDFTCSDGNQCIPSSRRCDAIPFDCIDGSDEIGCSTDDGYGSWSGAPVQCLESEFMCKDKTMCVHASWKCDGSVDCSRDGSDEIGCSENSGGDSSSTTLDSEDGGDESLTALHHVIRKSKTTTIVVGAVILITIAALILHQRRGGSPPFNRNTPATYTNQTFDRSGLEGSPIIDDDSVSSGLITAGIISTPLPAPELTLAPAPPAPAPTVPRSTSITAAPALAPAPAPPAPVLAPAPPVPGSTKTALQVPTPAVAVRQPSAPSTSNAKKAPVQVQRASSASIVAAAINDYTVTALPASAAPPPRHRSIVGLSAGMSGNDVWGMSSDAGELVNGLMPAVRASKWLKKTMLTNNDLRKIWDVSKTDVNVPSNMMSKAEFVSAYDRAVTASGQPILANSDV